MRMTGSLTGVVSDTVAKRVLVQVEAAVSRGGAVGDLVMDISLSMRKLRIRFWRTGPTQVMRVSKEEICWLSICVGYRQFLTIA